MVFDQKDIRWIETVFDELGWTFDQIKSSIQWCWFSIMLSVAFFRMLFKSHAMTNICSKCESSMEMII
jgi:hypothetical protein